MNYDSTLRQIKISRLHKKVLRYLRSSDKETALIEFYERCLGRFHAVPESLGGGDASPPERQTCGGLKLPEH